MPKRWRVPFNFVRPHTSPRFSSSEPTVSVAEGSQCDGQMRSKWRCPFFPPPRTVTIYSDYPPQCTNTQRLKMLCGVDVTLSNRGDVAVDLALIFCQPMVVISSLCFAGTQYRREGFTHMTRCSHRTVFATSLFWALSVVPPVMAQNSAVLPFATPLTADNLDSEAFVQWVDGEESQLLNSMGIARLPETAIWTTTPHFLYPSITYRGFQSARETLPPHWLQTASRDWFGVGAWRRRTECLEVGRSLSRKSQR